MFIQALKILSYSSFLSLIACGIQATGKPTKQLECTYTFDVVVERTYLAKVSGVPFPSPYVELKDRYTLTHLVYTKTGPGIPGSSEILKEYKSKNLNSQEVPVKIMNIQLDKCKEVDYAPADSF